MLRDHPLVVRGDRRAQLARERAPRPPGHRASSRSSYGRDRELLCSRLWYPTSPEAATEAERDAAAELRRLDETARMRAAAAWLQARPILGQDVFTRPQRRDARTRS